MLIIDPPATAGGTDIYPSEMLTFEAKERNDALVKSWWRPAVTQRISVGYGQYDLR